MGEGSAFKMLTCKLTGKRLLGRIRQVTVLIKKVYINRLDGA